MLFRSEGHGLAASQQARAVYQAVTTGDWGHGEARHELERADEIVRRGAIFQKENVAFCMSFTEVDPERMEIRHANAGMPFPLLFRVGQSRPETLQAAGVYVGAGYARYPVKPERATAKVEDGALLVLFSDGITEARDARGRLFGQQGITAAVARVPDASADAVADEILRAVRQHAAKEEPDDDQTLVVVLIGHPVTPSRTVEFRAPEESEGVFALVNGADTFSRLDQLRERIHSLAAGHDVSPRRASQIWQATFEAIQNALKHGSQPGDVVSVRIAWKSSAGRAVIEVEVRQPRLWEDWDHMLGAARRREVEAGRFLLGGTVLMLWLASEVVVTDLGQRTLMRFSPDVVSDRKVVADTAAILSGHARP